MSKTKTKIKPLLSRLKRFLIKKTVKFHKFAYLEISKKILIKLLEAS